MKLGLIIPFFGVVVCLWSLMQRSGHGYELKDKNSFLTKNVNKNYDS